MWVVSANTQFAAATKKTISGFRVFPGSARTLVKRGGITNQHSKAYCVSKMCQSYQNRLICVEILACNISVVFWTIWLAVTVLLTLHEI